MLMNPNCSSTIGARRRNLYNNHRPSCQRHPPQSDPFNIFFQLIINHRWFAHGRNLLEFNSKILNNWFVIQRRISVTIAHIIIRALSTIVHCLVYQLHNYIVIPSYSRLHRMYNSTHYSKKRTALPLLFHFGLPPVRLTRVLFVPSERRCNRRVRTGIWL